MTNDADGQAQPALWEAHMGAQPAGTNTRSRLMPSKVTSVEASELWTIDQVANYLGVPKQTIYCWRTTGYGPQGFRVGKHLRWRAATVLAWVADLERKQ